MTTVGPSKGRFLGNNYTNQNGQCLANIDPNIMLDLLSQAKHLTKEKNPVKLDIKGKV